MIKRQKTFTCKCKFKETFRKLFLEQALLCYIFGRLLLFTIAKASWLWKME